MQMQILPKKKNVLADKFIHLSFSLSQYDPIKPRTFVTLQHILATNLLICTCIASLCNTKMLSSTMVMMIFTVIFSLLFSTMPLSVARTMASGKDILDHYNSLPHNLGIQNDSPSELSPIHKPQFQAQTTSKNNLFGSLYEINKKVRGGSDPIHNSRENNLFAPSGIVHKHY